MGAVTARPIRAGKQCHWNAILILAAALTLPLTEPNGCRLDTATVVHVPPSAVQVIAVYDCPMFAGSTFSTMCWRRWTEQEGKRIGAQGEACEAQGASGGAGLTVPTRDRPQPVMP